jgi:hypothetical protein
MNEALPSGHRILLRIGVLKWRKAARPTGARNEEPELAHP